MDRPVEISTVLYNDCARKKFRKIAAETVEFIHLNVMEINMIVLYSLRQFVMKICIA